MNGSLGWRLASVLWGILLAVAMLWISNVSADVSSNREELAKRSSVIDTASSFARENGSRIGKIERAVSAIERDVSHNKDALTNIDSKLDRLLERRNTQ